MTLTPSTVSAFFDGYSVRGQEQIDALTNSAKHGDAVQNNYLVERVTIDFTGASYAANDYIALGQIKAGSTVLWNDVKVVLGSALNQNLAGTVGYLQNSDATYLTQGTLVATETALSTIVPDADADALEETQWLALKIGGTPPTAGKATFFVPYIATN